MWRVYEASSTITLLPLKLNTQGRSNVADIRAHTSSKSLLLVINTPPSRRGMENLGPQPILPHLRCLPRRHHKKSPSSSASASYLRSFAESALFHAAHAFLLLPVAFRICLIAARSLVGTGCISRTVPLPVQSRRRSAPAHAAMVTRRSRRGAGCSG